MKLTHRITTMAAAVAIVSGGAIAVDAAQAPEAQAACYSGLTETKAKNVSCKPKMRHWVVSRQSGTHYGKTVSPGGTSRQAYCYVDVASRGVTIRQA